jgi:hypothetical protein
MGELDAMDQSDFLPGETGGIPDWLNPKKRGLLGALAGIRDGKVQPPTPYSGGYPSMQVPDSSSGVPSDFAITENWDRGGGSAKAGPRLVDRIQDDPVSRVNTLGSAPAPVPVPTLLRPGEKAGPAPPPTAGELHLDDLRTQLGALSQPSPKMSLMQHIKKGLPGALGAILPIIAGKAFGGEAGMGGAARGVVTGQEEQRTRRQKLEDQKEGQRGTLRQQIEAERGRQESETFRESESTKRMTLQERMQKEREGASDVRQTERDEATYNRQSRTLAQQIELERMRESNRTADIKTKADQAVAMEKQKQAGREKLETMRGTLRKTIAAQGRASAATSSSRTMAEMARSVREQVPVITGEIDAIAGKLGPGIGRWNELWVNKVGFNDPDFAGLDTDLDLFASALVRTHFGARGGQQYRAELKKQFSEAQTADNLKARLLHADKWLAGYAKLDQQGTGSPTTKIEEGAPAAKPGAKPSSARPQADFGPATYKDGTVVPDGKTGGGGKYVSKGGRWVPKK